MKMTNAKRIALCAVLTTVALIFSYVESFVPMPIPGMKLGLANLIPLLLIPTVGLPAAATVSLLRILLASLLFGSPVSFVYSIVGGIVSFLVMALFFKLKVFGLPGVSILGGTFHNVGQTIVAIFLFGTARVIVLLPALLLSGAVAGCLLGLLATLILKRLKRSEVLYK